MRRFLSSLIRNTVLVNVLMVIFIFLGVVSGTQMVREVFPEISVDILMITMVYPGADPEDVEEGISRKIEETIDGIEGIKKFTTVSSEGISRTVIEVVEGFPVDRVYTDVRNAIDSISTFPVDAERPIISEATIKSEVILLTLWGDQPEAALKEFAEQIKDELQALPSVSQVNVFGTREYEIGIELSEQRLREYGLTFADVASAVRRGSLNLSGGELRTRGEQIRLRTVGRKYTGEEFASIVVKATPEGDIITLGQIATIKDGFTEDEVFSDFNGQPAVTVGVFKTASEDAIKIARDVRRFAEQKQNELPEGLHVTLWSDRSEFIQQRLNMLMRNGLVGLTIVFLALWLFLDLRLSFWVTMGIPISLGGGLFVMWLVGATLNELSLFGLIMVLGIVVDDAIIVGEAIYYHRKKGEPPMVAATSGVMEVGIPVLAAVTTSIIAFIPLFFVKGVMGRFIEIIPVAVIAALTISLIESLFLLPAHLNHLPDMSERAMRQRNPMARVRISIAHGLEWFVEHVYLPFMNRLIHFRYITASVAVVVLMITAGLVGGGFVKFVLFPEFDQQDIVANVEFPNGTPADVTARAVRQTEKTFYQLAENFPQLNGKPVVRNVQAVVGQSGGSEFDTSAGNNFGFIRVELAPAGERTITAQQILSQWEQATGIVPGAISQTFETREEGPPGAAIQISLSGHDTPTLLAVANEIKNKLRTYSGVYQIEDTYRPGKNELRIDIKPEAQTLGIQLDDLARQVYAGYFGEEAVRLQRGRDDIRVRVRYTEDERSTLAELGKIRIRTPQGYEVPFFSVADVEFNQGLAAIARVDGLRNVTVSAEVDQSRANAENVLADIQAHTLPRLETEYPGFLWSFEGAKQQSSEAFQGLMISFPIALLAMFVIIAAVFRSYIQPVLILCTVPFGIVGGVWGHFIMGLDLALFSVFGMVAVTGVVVNDAIVYIEAVNRNLAHGMPVFQAITRGGARRFRAILLTTISTVGGLAPIILERGAGAEVVVGMALSLASGVIFATVLTLVFLPCWFGILNDLRRVFVWFAFQRWPEREDVEPATTRYHDPLAGHDTDEPSPAISGEPIAAK